MTIKIINKNNTKESLNIKVQQDCKIQDTKPRKYHDDYRELPYLLSSNDNKNVKLSGTQYTILKSLAKGMYYDYCDAIDDDNVLTANDLEMAYNRFKNGENIFRIPIKNFSYSKTTAKATVIAGNGEYLSVDFETNFEKRNKGNKFPNLEYWEDNKIKDYEVWKKEKELENFLHALGHRESRNNYSVVNRIGYLGRFQLGEAALSDIGLYSKDDTIKNDWKGKWTEKALKYNINSKKGFLNNKKAQDFAIFNYIKRQWAYLKSYKLDSAIGTKINGHEITLSGLLAASHLVGVGSVKKYIESNGKIIAKDGNKVSLEEYLTKFGGYDIAYIFEE